MGWLGIKSKINKYTVTGLMIGVFPLIKGGIDILGIYSLISNNKSMLHGYLGYLSEYIAKYPLAYYAAFFIIGLTLVVIGFNYKKPTPFSFYWSDDREPFWERINPQHLHVELQTLRIMVTNKSSEPIGRFWVFLGEIQPQPNALYAFPVTLKFSDDLSTATSQRRILMPHQKVFIDIASLETDFSQGDTLFIRHANHENSQDVPVQSYTFTLEARGSSVQSKTIKMYIYIKDGKLNIKRVDSFIAKLVSRIQGFWKAAA